MDVSWGLVENQILDGRGRGKGVLKWEKNPMFVFISYAYFLYQMGLYIRLGNILRAGKSEIPLLPPSSPPIAFSPPPKKRGGVHS